MKCCNPLSAAVMSSRCLGGSRWAANREEPVFPNIVFIMAGDLAPGWVDFDRSSPKINTPNPERLAESGMVFARAYAMATVCSATRAGCISVGRRVSAK